MAAILPRIMYGTAWKEERTTALVITAVREGFQMIDTAGQPKNYREDLFGDALQELYEKRGFKREDLFIQTKYTPIEGQDTSKPIPYDPSDTIEDQLHASLAKSLSNLQTSYLDSYVLHGPFEELSVTLEAWKVLAKFQDEGKVRMVGICHTYDVQTLQALNKVRKVQIVQNGWHEGNQWDKEVVDYCKRNGIIYQSFWTLSHSPNLLSHPKFLTIARANNITPEQTIYKLAQLRGITVLSGTTDVQHMKQDLKVENFELKEDGIREELETIRKLIGY